MTPPRDNELFLLGEGTDACLLAKELHSARHCYSLQETISGTAHHRLAVYYLEYLSRVLRLIGRPWVAMVQPQT